MQSEEVVRDRAGPGMQITTEYSTRVLSSQVGAHKSQLTRGGRMLRKSIKTQKVPLLQGWEGWETCGALISALPSVPSPQSPVPRPHSPSFFSLAQSLMDVDSRG